MTAYERQTEYYRNETERSLRRYLPDDGGGRVAEAMRYSLFGGKRVRAILALAVADMLSGGIKAALPASAAVEMVHAYSLIHDDLPSMDDDSLRRGRPACHIAYGEAVALLAGDGLLTLAFHVITEADDPRKSVAFARLLSGAAGYRGMIFGQELDLAAERLAIGEMSAEELARMQRHKTGALISAAAAMGAVAAGASAEERGAVDAFADSIGNVFQIVDDLLDYLSDTETIGKPAGSDQKSHKQTSVTVLGVERSKAKAAELTERAKEALECRFDGRARYLTEFAGRLLNRIS